MTESEIVDRMSKDDIGSFDFLYQKYNKAVFNNILKFIYQTDIAEDLLQDVFTTMWEHRKKIDASQHIGGWLITVSHNKSIAFLKKRVREKIKYISSIEDFVVTQVSDTNEAEEMHFQRLHDAINSLSPSKQRVFRLCRLQGKSYSEAAQIQGVSVETVKEYMKDAYKAIRKIVLLKNSSATYLIIYTITLNFLA